MKVYIDSYNTCIQNKAGGVQSKIKDTYAHLLLKGFDVKLFDKWHDKVEECDILHLFKLSNEYFSLLQLAKQRGVKIVLSSIVALQGERRLFTGMMLWKYLRIPTPISYSKRIIDLSDILITETILEKEFLCKNYKVPESKVVVIPNGISPKVLNGDPQLFRQEYGLNGKFVLQVGRFDKNKNQLTLVRALKGTDIPVVFIGGPDSSDLEYFDQCKREATSNMIFTGWMDHSNPLFSSALAAADVLVLPSHKEIFGNVIFEGIANSCKIVATNVLPIKHWNLGDMVIPINPYDEKDIRQAVLHSMSMECNNDIVNKVLNDYSFSNIAEQHISIYKSILGK